VLLCFLLSAQKGFPSVSNQFAFQSLIISITLLYFRFCNSWIVHPKREANLQPKIFLFQSKTIPITKSLHFQTSLKLFFIGSTFVCDCLSGANSRLFLTDTNNKQLTV